MVPGLPNVRTRNEGNILRGLIYIPPATHPSRALLVFVGPTRRPPPPLRLHRRSSLPSVWLFTMRATTFLVAAVSPVVKFQFNNYV